MREATEARLPALLTGERSKSRPRWARWSLLHLGAHTASPQWLGIAQVRIGALLLLIERSDSTEVSDPDEAQKIEKIHSFLHPKVYVRDCAWH